MTPKVLMILGVTAGLTIICMEIFIPGNIHAGFTAFVSGACLGKGYGLWEERNKR